MTEPMFFKREGGLTASDIVALMGAVPRDGAQLDRHITDLRRLTAPVHTI